MNISYNWLKQYLDFDLTPEQLSEVLTSIGLETGGIEEVESIRGGLRGLVVAKVLSCVEHPDSDHLHITTVDLGDGNPVQIVCGAKNVAAGQTVIVATIGTTLYDGDKEFKIKKSKMRGVESFGMICAEDEIGVGNSHDGIIVIDSEVAPGTPAAEFYKLTSDYVLEVDLTPNRIDAASHYGVARDVAAWLAANKKTADLHRPDIASFKPDCENGAIPVKVEDTEGCIRYCGLTIRNVDVHESPEWLKNRLTSIGLRPINNVVDITNYLLHAFGQPLHCFDLNKIKGEEIVVRTCPEGTPFTTLDGVERKLSETDLMICNAREPMCIAGVFGGLDSGVTDETKSVFLESACFHPTRVRKTARRHALNTDSSFRFERGVDPNNTMYVLMLAAILVKELAGGEICGAPVDIYPNPVLPAEVELNFNYLRNLVGKDIPEETILSILKSLEFEQIAASEQAVTYAVPTYRVDVTRPCDIVEEFLRIYGYNNIELPSSLKASLSFKNEVDEAEDLKRIVCQQLSAEGFNEILNNSLTAHSYYDSLTTFVPEKCVTLLNPLSSDLNVMRQTLLFGGLESLAHNINRREQDLAFYEFGNVYFFNPQAESTVEKPLAPFNEQSRLALWLTGMVQKASWNRQAVEASVYDLKAIVLNIFTRLGIENREIVLRQVVDNDIFASALSVETRSGKQLGSLGILAKAILKLTDIKQPVLFAELNWDALVKLAAKKKVKFTPLPKTQNVVRDLALLVDNNVKMEQIENVVAQSERRLLKNITLFDVYEGKNLPEGKKSYAISIVLHDEEKTMTDKQIDSIMSKIVENLKKQLGAQLR